MAYVFKSIPGPVLRVMDRGWLHPFLVWLDAVLANLTGGGTGAAFAPVRLLSAASPAAYVYASVAQTLTFGAAASESVDGVVTALGDRIWLNHGASADDNGLYTVTTKGTGVVFEVWTRAADGNVSADFVAGKLISAGPDGVVNAGVVKQLTVADGFVLDTNPVTIGDPSNVLTVNSAQTVLGVKSFAQLALALWNGAKTFAGAFTTAVTAARTWTMQDRTYIVAGTDDVAAAQAASQPLDSDLTAIAAIAANGVLARTGAGAWTTAAASALGLLGIQTGSATIDDVTGKSAAIAATITASSRVVAFLKTNSGDALSVKYAALSTDRVVGAPGSFKLAALVAAGTPNTADASTLDWYVIG